jgi:hypothetical protein
MARNSKFGALFSSFLNGLARHWELLGDEWFGPAPRLAAQTLLKQQVFCKERSSHPTRSNR